MNILRTCHVVNKLLAKEESWKIVFPKTESKLPTTENQM